MTSVARAEPSGVRRLCVFARLNAPGIGDLVLRNIYVNLLRTAHPQSTVTLIVGESVYRAHRALIERHGYAADVLTCPDPPSTPVGPALPAAFNQSLHQHGFDLCLVDPDSVGLDASHAHHAGIPRRVALPDGGSGDRYITQPVRMPPPILGRSDLYEYATGLARALGVPAAIPAASLVPPFPYVSGTSPFAEGGVGARVVVHPGGDPRWNRRWPAEHYGELCARLGAAGAEVVLIGTAEERGDLRRLCDHAPRGGAPPTVLIPADLDGLATVLAAADLLVGNDSAPAHIAAALRVPTVVLYGPTDTEYLWSRIYPRHRGVSMRYPCRTLRRSAVDPAAVSCDRGCATVYARGGGSPRCLADLDVATVWGVVSEQLSCRRRLSYGAGA